MIDQTNVDQIKELVQQSTNIYVMAVKEASEEILVASLALKAALEQKGKNVSVFCDSEKVKNISFLEESQVIKKKIAPQDLVIGLGYPKDDIEKVGYDTKNGQFLLVITPKKGRLDVSRVTYGEVGMKADLFIVLGSSTLEDVGASYTDNQKDISDREVINIDNQESNTFFATANSVDSEKSTVTEVVIKLLEILEIDLRDRIGNLLLTGIYLGTNSFKDAKVNSQTFASVSTLLSKGVKLQEVVSALYSGSKEELKTDPKPKVESGERKENISPTPFVKGPEMSKESVEIEEPPIFDKTAATF